MIPYLLCLDTSTDICSVGLFHGEELLAIKETERSFSHSEVISLFIEDVIQQGGISPQDLSAVAVAGGPGSYTALRIGVSTAKGLCYALDIPLIALDTLDILVEGIKDQASEEDVIVPLLDARRKEVYRAIYSGTGDQLSEVEPYILNEHSFEFLSGFNKVHFVGDGVPKSKEILSIGNGVFHELLNSARWMGELVNHKYAKGDYEDLHNYEPFYYKTPNITTSKKKFL